MSRMCLLTIVSLFSFFLSSSGFSADQPLIKKAKPAIKVGAERHRATNGNREQPETLYGYVALSQSGRDHYLPLSEDHIPAIPKAEWTLFKHIRVVFRSTSGIARQSVTFNSNDRRGIVVFGDGSPNYSTVPYVAPTAYLYTIHLVADASAGVPTVVDSALPEHRPVVIRYKPAVWRFDHIEIGRVMGPDSNRGIVTERFSVTSAFTDLPDRYSDRNALRTDFLRRRTAQPLSGSATFSKAQGFFTTLTIETFAKQIKQKGASTKRLPAAKIIIRQNGKIVARGRSNGNGKWSTKLKPGNYVVETIGKGYGKQTSNVTLSSKNLVHPLTLTSLGPQPEPPERPAGKR
jgi:hypothetical protein